MFCEFSTHIADALEMLTYLWKSTLLLMGQLTINHIHGLSIDIPSYYNNRTTHYKWAIFNSKLLVYQRVEEMDLCGRKECLLGF